MTFDDPYHTSELYQSMTLPIQEKRYIVIHAGPDPEQSPVLASEIIPEEAMEALQNSAKSMVQEIFADVGTCYRMNQTGFLLMAIGIRDGEARSDAECLEEIRERLAVCVRAFWEKLRLSIYIAASRIMPAERSPYVAFKEAQAIAVHFPFLDKSLHVLTGYDVQNGLSESAAEMKKELELLWYHAMENGNYPLAAKHTLRILDIRAGAPKTAITLKQELIARLSYMFYTACDNSKITGEALIYLLSAADNLRGTKDLHALKSQTSALFELLSAISSEEKAGASLPIVEQISAFVNENYADPQMNATLISEQFSLNASYLSSMFHKSTGVKLLDYIHTVRINHVKQLLRTTKLDMASIAAQSGYISSIAMSRVFSRYVGLSPSEYRKSVSDRA